MGTTREMRQVERNLKGKDLEKAGNTKEAITLYEQNLSEGFDGSHPYERLAVIYKRLGKLEDEIRVLSLAVAIFGKVGEAGRQDGNLKLQKFKDRLEKAGKRKIM